VVERIAHVFGGSMRVESSPGRGSRFILRLPDATRSIVMEDHGRAVEPEVAEPG
jgi:chemotaxis protein histidine kinase CheA